MESLRRWRLSDDVWDYVEPRIRLWVVEQLIKHVNTPEFSKKNLRILAKKLGKKSTRLYTTSYYSIRPTYTYVPYVRFEDTLRT